MFAMQSFPNFPNKTVIGLVISPDRRALAGIETLIILQSCRWSSSLMALFNSTRLDASQSCSDSRVQLQRGWRLHGKVARNSSDIICMRRKHVTTVEDRGIPSYENASEDGLVGHFDFAASVLTIVCDSHQQTIEGHSNCLLGERAKGIFTLASKGTLGLHDEGSERI